MGWEIALPLLVAMAASALAVGFLIPLARTVGLLDLPDGARKDHPVATPVVGGLGIAFGSAVALTVLGIDGGDLRSMVALAVAGLLVLLLGIYDDLCDAKWYWRIGAQALAAVILVYGGGLAVNQVGTVFGYDIQSLGWLSEPFTIFMIVALINAINMADGVDGLTGSVLTVSLGMFAAAGFYSGDPSLGSFLVVMAGSVMGFLIFNLRRPGLPRAASFLGNGGSALLGLVIAWASLRLSQNPDHPITAVLLPWLLVPPVVDAVALVLRRISHGESPFHADRNHLHHFMLDAGFRPSEVALLAAVATLLAGGGAALVLRENLLDHTALVLLYVAMTVAYFLLTYRRERAVRMFVALRWQRPSLPGRRGDDGGGSEHTGQPSADTVETRVGRSQ